MRMYTSSRAKKKVLSSQKRIPDVFVDFRPPYYVHQYGVSIQSSIKLCETIRQITQKWCTTQT